MKRLGFDFQLWHEYPAGSCILLNYRSGNIPLQRAPLHSWEAMSRSRAFRYLWLALLAWVAWGAPAADRGNPLSNAADRGDAGQIRRLLDQGADPNARDRYSETPLMIAVTLPLRAPFQGKDPAGVVKLLLTRGANPNLQDNSGKSALIHALTGSATERAGRLAGDRETSAGTRRRGQRSRPGGLVAFDHAGRPVGAPSRSHAASGGPRRGCERGHPEGRDRIDARRPLLQGCRVPTPRHD